MTARPRLTSVRTRLTSEEKNNAVDDVPHRRPFTRAFCFAFTGCTFSKDDLPGQVGKYSGSIEQLVEEAILTNIVRASDGAPLGFTQLAVVRGSGSLTTQIGIPTVTVGGPQTPGLKNLYQIGPNGVIGSGNTNFDLAILDTKEFWLGVLTPLSADTLIFFIRQGIPREILFDLYVQRVELSTPGKPTIIEVNDPSDPHYASFTNDLRDSLALGLTADTATRSFDVGPPLPANQAPSVNDLLNITKAGMSIAAVPSKDGLTYQMRASASGALICFDQANASVDLANRLPDAATCSAMKGQGAAPAAAAGAPFSFEQKATATRPPVSIKIYPRSTYDIFRYLGSLLRSSEQTGKYVDLTTDDAKAFGGGAALGDKLFVVKRNAPGDAYVSVRYGSSRYSIPKDATTSIQVLALVRQLIALSTSINALPQSGTVTTVVQ